MPAKLTRSEKIKKYKEKAPTYAGQTCKYIDHIIDVLDEEVKPLISEKDEDFFIEIQKQINAQLNFIRAANETLRDSSKYWYEIFKKEV
jgi:CTP synthase (UTP-ammonia lyase)